MPIVFMELDNLIKEIHMAQLIDGKLISQQIKDELKEEVAQV